MRVCFFDLSFYPGYGGAAIYLRDTFIPALQTRGVECWVIAREHPGRPVIDRYGDIDILRLPAPPACLPGRLRVVATWSAARRFLLAHKDKFDIVYFADGGGSSVLAMSPLRRAGKRTITEVTLLGKDDAHSFRARKLGGFTLRQLRKADRVLCISRALHQSYLHNGFTRRQAVYLPYGIRLDKFRPVSDDEKALFKARLGIGESTRVISFVGGINRRKNVKTLVDAFSQIANKYPECCLLLVGPYDKNKAGYADYYDEVRRAIDAYGLRDRVRFTGMVDNVQQYLQISDVYATASRSEGLVLAVLEAMACGVACVLSDIPSTPDVIPDLAHGQVCGVDDAGAFAAAFDRYLSDEPYRAGVARTARQRIEKLFGLERRVEETLDLFDRLLD